jgi:predicted O-methyltransferase YrrM
MMPRFNAHFIWHFIRHYLSATRIDVLHSPFVFDLYNSCIARQKATQFEPIEALRSQLLRDHTHIMQVDFGVAGEGVVKKKTVSEFAKLHAKPPRIAQILNRIVARYAYRHIIELGTSLGLTTAYIAAAVAANQTTVSRFTSAEGAADLAEKAKTNLARLGLDHVVNIETGKFDDLLPGILLKYEEIDMAFVDGNHRYEPTRDYFHQLAEKCGNHSMLIFDDIYWSKGMTRAWEEIKADPRVRVTIDLFFIGIVMFRKEQVKEHFRLRVL